MKTLIACSSVIFVVCGQNFLSHISTSCIRTLYFSASHNFKLLSINFLMLFDLIKSFFFEALKVWSKLILQISINHAEFICSAYFEVTVIFLPSAPLRGLDCFPLNWITVFQILSHSSIQGDPPEFNIEVPNAAIIFVLANNNEFCSRLSYYFMWPIAYIWLYGFYLHASYTS